MIRHGLGGMAILRGAGVALGGLLMLAIAVGPAAAAEEWEGPAFSEVVAPISTGGLGGGGSDFSFDVGPMTTMDIGGGGDDLSLTGMTIQVKGRHSISDSLAISWYYSSLTASNDQSAMKWNYTRIYYWPYGPYDYYEYPMGYTTIDVSDEVDVSTYGIRAEVEVMRNGSTSLGLIGGIVFGSSTLTYRDYDYSWDMKLTETLDQTTAGYELGVRGTAVADAFSITPFLIYQHIGLETTGEETLEGTPFGDITFQIDSMTAERNSLLYGFSINYRPEMSPVGYSFTFKSQSDLDENDDGSQTNTVVGFAVTVTSGALTALAGQLADWDGEPTDTGVGGVTGMTAKTYEIYGDDPVLHKMDPWKLYKKKAVAAEPAAEPAAK